MSGGARADLVYSTDFTGEEYSQVSVDIVFDGSATETWFGSNNGVGIGGGDLSFSNTSSNRYRGSGIWLDTTGWATGPVTVEVDVANFASGTNSDIIFQAYAANGVDASNTVSLDLHGAAGLDGAPMANGTATIATLGAEQLITSNGTAAFTFNFNGTDDFVGLTFAQDNANPSTDFVSADLDNLTVNTFAVPEPSSLMMLAAGIGAVTLRRRRV